MCAVKLLCLFLCLLCNTLAFRPFRVCYDETKSLPRITHSYSSIQDETLFMAVAGFGALVNTTAHLDLQVLIAQPAQGSFLYPHVRVNSNPSWIQSSTLSSTLSFVDSTRFEPKVLGSAGAVINSFPVNPDSPSILANSPLFITFGLNSAHDQPSLGSREFSNVITIPDVRSGNTPIIDPVFQGFAFRTPGVYLFGGFVLLNKTRTYYNSVTWYSTQDYSGQVLPATSVQTFNTTGTPPSPRASYGALPLTIGQKFFALYFGGENGTHYFNDLFQLEITPKQPQPLAWTIRNATADPVYGLPSPRAGFAMNYAREKDASFFPRDFYIFGGYNGTHYLNDFWKYQYDLNRWKRLDDENFRATIPPRAWHKGVTYYNGNTTSNFILYFGGRYANGSSALFAAVELFSDSDESKCPFLCTNMTDSSSTNICTRYNASLTSSMTSACISFEECMYYIKCPAGTSQCGLQCLPTDALAMDYGSLSWCARQRPTCTKVQCWNGLCLDSIDTCPMVVACPAGYRRCNGGSCVNAVGSSVSTCSAPDCGVGEEMCFDGSCKPAGTCLRAAGCVPSQENYQCLDGRCVADAQDCLNTSSTCDDGTTQCWDGTCGTLANCTAPNWIQPLKNSDYPRIESDGYIFLDIEPVRDVDFYKRPYNLYGLVQIQRTATNPKSITFRARATPPATITSIGPEPSWRSEFDPTYITTPVATITFTGLAPVQPDSLFYLLLRHQPNFDYASVPDGDFLDRQKYCFAKAVPWYWADADVSPISNVSYIQSYAAWHKTANSTSTPPPFGQPTLRWKCMAEGYPNSSTLNRWPSMRTEVAEIFPERIIGISVTEDLTDTPVAIIRWEGPYYSPPVGIRAAETNVPAHYIIDGIIAVAFIVLITVVTIKACCAGNS